MRLADGYEGWAHKPYLTSDPAPIATHIVTPPFTPLNSDPDDSLCAMSRIVAGTHVCVTSVRSEFAKVGFAGAMQAGGWVALSDLRPVDQLPLSPIDARKQILADARKLTGLYYLWGGNTAWGTDCSGLVWLTHRLAGYSIPPMPIRNSTQPRLLRPPTVPAIYSFSIATKIPTASAMSASAPAAGE